ncbi:MAG: hypothetical protein WB699_08070 [Bacteroidota bacterium]
MRFWKMATLLALASIPLFILGDRKKPTVRPIAAEADDSIDWEAMVD